MTLLVTQSHTYARSLKYLQVSDGKTEILADTGQEIENMAKVRVVVYILNYDTAELCEWNDGRQETHGQLNTLQN